MKNVSPQKVVTDDVLTYTTFQGEFVSSVVESGDIESSSNQEIRCKVKSQGKAGTAIISIIEEGSQVNEGDFLCQLDDSILVEQLTHTKDSGRTGSGLDDPVRRATSIQPKEFLMSIGTVTYEQELAGLKAEVAFAEETSRRAREMKIHSENLNRKGYITKTQLEADKFAMDKAELNLELAKQKLSVYERFTQDRMVSEFEAEIEKQEANLEAAQFTLELSQARQKETAHQIESCHVVAPNAGTVIYANETDRRGDASFVIEEGAVIRDGQPIFFLPDPTRMQVRTTVSDSKINQVVEEQRALVRVDTDPEKPIAARVRRVGAFPLPRRWYQAPIEYEVFVDIVETSDLIRPGLRGKVEIITERIEDVIQTPVSALLRENDRYFVLVKKGDDLEVRAVEIGSNNEQFVVIKSGVDVGEEVLVDPDPFQDVVEFPSS